MQQSYINNIPEAGCDEAGRGCLAGPVVAAAVILPDGFHHPVLNDSKKLSPGSRELLREVIEKDAVSWAIGIADNREIDNLNILNASILAMHRALSGLATEPEHIIVDGNRFKKFRSIPHTCIVKGDSLYASIAAASVLAKTFRDAIMLDLHEKFPLYGWNTNKGYPTKMHIDSMGESGPSPYHRKSFRLRPKQLSMHFNGKL